MDPLYVAFKVSLVGICVVFLALVLVGFVISLLRRLDEPLPVVEPTQPDEVPEEIVAAISAALTVALGAAVKIKRVRYGQGSHEHNWSQQGRVTIMASHVTRE